MKKILIFKSLFMATFLAAIFCCGILAYLFRYPCVDFSILTQQAKGLPSILYDEKGIEWGRFCYDKREYVSIHAMPDHLLKAFIAAEDWDFYNHHGLSLRSIIRSLIVNMSHGKIVQGASTITQQLVKMLFYDNNRTFKRKIKEQFLTILVEQQFSKEQILENYLNHVYFGSGLYGVESAAQRFWGISVSDLTVDQSALLAAIICSPGHYSPFLFPYSAVNRRNVILSKMKHLQFISEQEYAFFLAKKLTIKSASDDNCAPYVKEYIRTFIEEKIGKEALYKGGLVIHTTINKKMQEDAQKVFSDHFLQLKKLYGADLEGALISMNRSTGAIKALIGGTHFKASHFNRALYAQRQQGSIFKPVLYATALTKGVSLLDTAVDEPIKVQHGANLWQPRNHTRTFDGKMTLARALSFSNNIISVKLILYFGAQEVVQYARKCRLQGDIFPYPSLALGCLDSTLLEVTGMFNIFANDGVYCKPHIISLIKDQQGEIMYEHIPEQEQIFPMYIAHQIAQVLTVGLDRKKYYSRSWIDSQALSKTGTTNDSRTCWFAGSTPEVTTVVYVGCDDNRPMGKNVFPLHTAYPIWLSYHLKVPTVQKEFLFDSSLKEVLVDWKTGEIVKQKQAGKEIYPLLI